MNIEDLTEYRKEPCPAWAIEDYLQQQECFTHNGHVAHLDSYLTLFEFNKVEESLKIIKEVFSLEQWKSVIEYWASNSYLSPNQLLLSKIAGRIIFKL